MDGAELRKLRLRRGLTQRQVAAEIGVSQQMISRMERGERPVPSRPRPLYRGASGDAEHDPSVLEELEDLLALTDDELHDGLLADAPRGPYKDARPDQRR